VPKHPMKTMTTAAITIVAASSRTSQVRRNHRSSWPCRHSLTFAHVAYR